MTLDDDLVKQAHALIQENRARCLWFLREDFLPVDPEGLARAMTYIERRGNRESYIKARRIRECLSHNSSETSAG